MKKCKTKELEDFCRQLGFDLFGVIEPKQNKTIKYFERWLRNHYQAEMKWLEKLDKRREPTKVLNDCRSVLVLGVSYFNRNYTQKEIKDKNKALIARYAWGNDYHEVLGNKMKKIVTWLKENYGDNYQHKFYIDTGPILEKTLAQEAGLGFFGKNTLLINHKIGSYFFIACLFTQIPFEVTEKKVIGGCGNCQKCIQNCPTGALVKPYVLDANKCLSYQTIENRGDIPKKLKKKMNNRIFGCDICQEVCPWNKRAKVTSIDELKTKQKRDQLTIDQLKKMDTKKYQQLFTKSAVKRAKFAGLKRNLGL